jgi:glycerophosphoryl diester phosphodiesterase
MKIIGHRGAKDIAPENTLASIQAALDAGADAVEIDVRVTRDSVVVLSHDRSVIPSANPTTPATLPSPLAIDTSTYVELQQLKPDISTLTQAINHIGQKVPLMIEVKPGVPTEPIRAILDTFLQAGWQPENLWLGSKSQSTLRTLHAALPTLPCVVIEPWSGVIATHRARQLGTNRLAMNHHFLWFGFIRLISRQYQLYAYPLNDLGKAERWAKYGLAGAITDNPTGLKRSKPSKPLKPRS